MKDKDAKIFVISMKNISKELQYYGTSNINNINLLKLIYKYAKYFTDYKCLQAVDKMVNYLQRSDRRICMEFTYTKGYSYEYNTVDISEVNTALEKLIENINLTTPLENLIKERTEERKHIYD